MAKAELTQLHAKTLPHAFRPDLVAFCDPHDLVAIVSDNGEVPVYRINGQIAFTVKRRAGEEAHATAVSWKQDGSCLAVGWSDGLYGVYSGENGHLISQSSIRNGGSGETPWPLDLAPAFGSEDDDEDGHVVKCFGWNRHLPHTGSDVLAPGSTVSERAEISTEDWLDGSYIDGEDVSKGPRKDESGSLLELARAITTFDVTERIPKLSATPAHGLRAGPDGSKFASQAATDSIFQAQQDVASTALDTLLVCSGDGSVQMLMNETVRVGSCKVNGIALRHAAVSNSETQIILSSADERSDANFINLPLDTLGGPLLHVIATNTRRIQNLLVYITHTVRCMHHDLTTGLQFPTRLLNNMNAELGEKDEEGDVVLQLYHLAMTGEFNPTMLEWLVDIVKETNHKRWDQAINGFYTNIQNHIFINLLPALDRLTIAVTTLRGHARFHEGTSRFNVSPANFNRILDAIDSLRLVAQKLQLIVIEELRRFRAFSKWLRVMIDIGVAGPGGKTAVETEEREVPNLDYPLLLSYISETMTASQIKRYIEPLAEMQGSVADQEAFFAHPLVTHFSYDRTTQAVESIKDGKVAELKDVPNVNALLNLPTLAVILSGTIRVAMEEITRWQSRMLEAPTSLQIEVEGTVVDMTTEYLLVVEREAKVVLQPLGSGKGVRTLVEGGRVLSAAFSGTRTVLTLVEEEGEHAILETSVSDVQETQRVHSFQPPFVPSKLVVGGREGKRVLVALERNDRGWRVYDLDSVPRQERKRKETYVDDQDEDMSEY